MRQNHLFALFKDQKGITAIEWSLLIGLVLSLAIGGAALYFGQ